MVTFSTLKFSAYPKRQVPKDLNGRKSGLTQGLSHGSRNQYQQGSDFFYELAREHGAPRHSNPAHNERTPTNTYSLKTIIGSYEEKDKMAEALGKPLCIDSVDRREKVNKQKLQDKRNSRGKKDLDQLMAHEGGWQTPSDSESSDAVACDKATEAAMRKKLEEHNRRHGIKPPGNRSHASPFQLSRR